MGRLPGSNDRSSEGKVTPAWLRLIPNGLTVLRLVLAFAFPFIPASWWLPVVIVATLTEFLDGFLARRWGVVTPLGRQMDPVADKVFVVAVFATFFWRDLITIPAILGVASRDLMVIVGGFLAWGFGLGKDFLEVSPKYSGKVATTMQFVFMISVCAFHEVVTWMLVLTILASVVSACDYFLLGILALRKKYASPSSPN